jgi:large subunit ribosomal protein L31
VQRGQSGYRVAICEYAELRGRDEFYLRGQVKIPTFANSKSKIIVRPNPYHLQTEQIMKKDIHPKGYRFVVFKDMSNGVTFLSKSSAQSRETIKYEDGNEYPLIKLEISNTSHPFFTGKNMLVDTAGRIDKFKKRYEKKAK